MQGRIQFRYFFICLTTALLAGSPSGLASTSAKADASSESSDTISVTETAQAVQDLVESVAEIGKLKCSTPPASVPLETQVRVFSRARKCDDLLALAPPKWVTQSPQAGIFKTETNWRPFCSLFELQTQVTKQKKPDWNQALAEVSRNTATFDYCANAAEAAAHPPKRQPNPTPTPAKKVTQKSAGVVPMNSGDQAVQRGLMNSLKGRMAQTCCRDPSGSTDRDCVRLVNEVRLEFCQTGQHPEDEEKCIDSPLYYLADSRRDDYIRSAFKNYQETLIVPEATHDFPLGGGRIVVGNFKNQKSGELWGTPEAFGHELGHACSTIRRSLAIQRESAFGKAAFRSLLFDDCHIGSYARTTYEHLFANLGLSPETFVCEIAWSTEAKQGHYGGTCPDGCPTAHLEEAYANLHAMLTIETKDYFPSLIPDYCGNVKDAAHNMKSDDVRCALKTPKLREKFEEALGCLH